MKLSIIVLNHNSGSLLVQCLDSVLADDLPTPFEIIVPDNASTDDSLGLVTRKWGERVTILHNGGNQGFSWGNNKGVAAARGEYVCLLNPDTVVHRGTFATLVSFLESHPKAACVGPKVLNKDGSFQLSAKRSIPSPFDAISRALFLSRLFPNSRRFARYNMTYLDPGVTQQVDASTGCCMLFPRKALDAVGLLDDGYFIYCEDVDWFIRAKSAGWEVWYVAEAVIEHHHAYSTEFRKRRSVENFHDSMIRLYRKHYAARYPAPFNAFIYTAVRARMHAMIAYKTLRGWR